MVNRVVLVGNLTRDAEAVESKGKPMTRLRLATNSAWRDSDGNKREATQFHTVVCFARLAEVAALYSKGRRVYIEGRLRTREYRGGDGVRKSSTEIVAQTVKLLQRNGADRTTEAAAPAEVEA